MMRLVSLVVLLSSLSLGASAEFNPLLPRPQEIHYGSGWLRVRGVRVHLPPGSTEEDRFAAQTLAQFLSDRAKGAMEISEGDASEPAIVLIRSGAVDPLPVPDERPGPESREAYWLKVTPRGAEIRAVSSAGLFYGVQTLCQLVEGSAEEAKLPEVEIHDWPALAYREPWWTSAKVHCLPNGRSNVKLTSSLAGRPTNIICITKPALSWMDIRS